MGKITPNRIAFVILPEEVTLVLYLLYILLGAREHIIHTYIHSNNFARDSRQQYLFTHKCNFTLLCSGWFVWPEAKKLSWENAMRLVAFSRVFAALFPLSRNKPPLRRQGVSHFVLLFNKKIPQTTHVDYKVAQKN